MFIFKAFILFLYLVYISSQSIEIVETPYGNIAGQKFNVYTSFLGIPYAKPPINQLRWKSPIPNDPWYPNTYNAFNISSACYQSCEGPPGLCPENISEDCLYLNIFKPSNTNVNVLLPVLFWIHGGQFLDGHGGSLIYNGRYLSNQTNTILVSFNYRMGAFGFLKTDTIDGSFGFQDQQLALKWVQDNIKFFNGDPNRVTIFGQSAGAISVGLHLSSPSSAGYFNKAIMQSNPFSLPLHTPESGLAISNLFANQIGCLPSGKFNSSCLYSVSADIILKAQGAVVESSFSLSAKLAIFLPWSPLVTTKDLPCQLVDCFAKNVIYNKVPLILGSTTEESRLFVYYAIDSALSWETYSALSYGLFGLVNGYEVLNRYPSNLQSDCRDSLSTLGTDYLFTCPTRYVANMTLAMKVPVYMYVYEHVTSIDMWDPTYPFCTGHVCHGAALPFLFQSAELVNNTAKITSDEASMSLQLTQYWGNFAYNGDPNINSVNNGIDVPSWPMFSIDNGDYLMMQSPNCFSSSTSYHSGVCDFFDSIGYNY